MLRLVYLVTDGGTLLTLLASVYLLLFLELIQTVLSTHWAWYILVSGWGIPSTVEALNWSAITIPIMAGLGKFSRQNAFAIDNNLATCQYQ